MLITDYIREKESAGAMKDCITASIKDYHAHEDYIPITTWDQLVGYMEKPKSIDTAIDGDDTDYILSTGRVFSLIRRHQIPYTEKETARHKILYVECPWSKNHTTERNETESFISIAKANGMINYRCNHTHCDGKHWKDYKEFYQARDGAGKEETENTAARHFDLGYITGKNLQKKNLPDIIYPVENMIPQGYIVGSAPFKYGKSWFALEMCISIAEGSRFLGQKTTKGAAVYLALEDCDKFAQERLNMALMGAEAPDNLYLIFNNVPTLDDGLIDYLNQLYEEIPDIKLVVIDILGLIEHQAKRGESAYKCDYRTGTALKKWADDHETSVLAITHTTKMVHPNDVFMNTTGTSGVTGSADAILTIAKENRTDKDAILAITGRRIREKYFKVHLKDGYLWETEGEVNPETMRVDSAKNEQAERLAEYTSSDIKRAIIKIADSGIQEELSARDIIDKARDQDIHLLSTPKEIGGFICKFQNFLFVEDRIKVYIRKRGTASNVYKFIVWDQVDEAQTPFDDAEVQ